MFANRDLWGYIMLVSMFLGVQIGGLCIPEFLPAPSWSNEKTPVWAWIASAVSLILLFIGWFSFSRLSGVTILNWDYIRSLFS